MHYMCSFPSVLVILSLRKSIWAVLYWCVKILWEMYHLPRLKARLRRQQDASAQNRDQRHAKTFKDTAPVPSSRSIRHFWSPVLGILHIFRLCREHKNIMPPPGRPSTLGITRHFLKTAIYCMRMTRMIMSKQSLWEAYSPLSCSFHPPRS